MFQSSSEARQIHLLVVGMGGRTTSLVDPRAFTTLILRPFITLSLLLAYTTMHILLYTVRHFGGWMSFTRTTEMRYEFGHRVEQVDGLRATGWMYGLHEAHE